MTSSSSTDISSSPLSESQGDQKQMLEEAARLAAHYLDGLDARAVFPQHEALAGLESFTESFPLNPRGPQDTLSMLDNAGSPATVATNGRRYFGFVIGGSLPASLAANVLAAAWDQNAGLYIASPITAKLEIVALNWLVDILGLPLGSGGGFVTGGTMANFGGLAAARHALLQREGWNAEAQGLFGAPSVTVIVGEEVHTSLLKALSLLGFGRERVVRVPVDGQGRMIASALPVISGPTIVCTQAGNVNTGAFDPIGEICRIAHQAGAWVHVDGAFGLWATAAPSRAYLTAGVDQADSWALDAHKWLNVPYDSGLVFCRHPEDLRSALTHNRQAAYLFEGNDREPMEYTPELSRRARGIEVWAALRSLGRTGLAELIDRPCRLASRFAAGLKAGGYTILNDVELNQVLVSFGDAEKTQRVIKAVQEDGTCWCGGTVWQGHTAMRISISSWATTESDIDQSLEAILRIAGTI